jgi:four helix bundle protein
MEYSHPDICQRTYKFAIRIIKVCTFLDSQTGVARTLAKQILRSGTSIGANVREAQSAQSDRDFIHKLEIALKEARETEYWLELLVVTEIVSGNRLNSLIDECKQLCKILIATTKKLKDKRTVAR